MPKNILVTNATGSQGGAVVEALIAHNNKIRAAASSSRHPNHIENATNGDGDESQYGHEYVGESKDASLFRILAVTRNARSNAAKRVAALSPDVVLVQGSLYHVPEIFEAASTALQDAKIYDEDQHKIWGVFSVQVSWGWGITEESETKQGQELVRAAILRNVQHFVYSSVERGGDERSWHNPTNIPHFRSKWAIERELRDLTRPIIDGIDGQGKKGEYDNGKEEEANGFPFMRRHNSRACGFDAYYQHQQQRSFNEMPEEKQQQQDSLRHPSFDDEYDETLADVPFPVMGWTILRPVGFMDKNLAPGMHTKTFLTALGQKFEAAEKQRHQQEAQEAQQAANEIRRNGGSTITHDGCDTYGGYNYDDGHKHHSYSLQPSPRMQWVSTVDIGIFAVKAFTNPAKWNGKAVGLAGDSLSMAEMDEVFRAHVKGCSTSGMPKTFGFLGNVMSGVVREMRLMMDFFAGEGYKADVARCRGEHPGMLTLAEWLVTRSGFEIKEDVKI